MQASEGMLGDLLPVLRGEEEPGGRSMRLVSGQVPTSTHLVAGRSKMSGAESRESILAATAATACGQEHKSHIALNPCQSS